MNTLEGGLQPDGPTADAGVKDTTTANFRADVIQASAQRPVLVDFWAPWCGPCKQLTPVLEKVVKAADGKVVLVKMNIDDHPQIAGQLGIQSIPAVIAFQKGQPIDGFMGALPESQIKGFIERLVGPLGGEADELMASAEAAFAAGDIEQAEAHFHDAFQIDSGDVRIAAGLARAKIARGDFESAKDILAPFANAQDVGGALTAARAALQIAEQAETVGDFADLEKALTANPNDHQARFDLAIAQNAAGKRAEAADSLLEIFRRDRNWNDGGARKQLLQFFEAWGHMDPDSIDARRKLSSMLFS